MTPELEAAVKSAAKIITETNPTYTAEQAETLARNVMEAAGVNFQAPAGKASPEPAPATRPPAPRIDVASLANASPAERYAAWRAHEKNLANWIDAQQSYVEPINEVAQAAKARLLELRAASEADTDAEKVRRAMEREKLMETIIAGGMARL